MLARSHAGCCRGQWPRKSTWSSSSWALRGGPTAAQPGGGWEPTAGGRFNDKERSAEVTHSGSDWRADGTTGGKRDQR